ncbi:MAG: GAF domain-containing protein [Pegethrix bostrychoides GSE-TBD4-15B]|jgi:DNA-binding CsgD family transcriptional regulator|uniref:GAF domain-containing protein n=1 Tax=Pegethrix bostrychoides GSE-TBD4-15B TaxID=2839662 RepID=A0A951U652_9CYAN|nr:GAF domain-containing protein [Pegethrix bostrychoides GSE-TBD4-15B]
MPDLLGELLNPTRILFDLQQSNEIAQSLAGCSEPEEIARRVTQGLVEKFGCAFARLWLLEPDRASLKLVASSGLYTRTDGSFARVPMGAYKVGKIAQNRVAFLSNNLAAEPWVGNQDWAIAHQIHGFAGYPLAIHDTVIGVLALFSHQVLEPEFLEVLQTLCTLVTTALEAALRYQRERHLSTTSLSFAHLPLSEQLASILSSTRLALVGTEQPLSLPVTYLILQAAQILRRLGCTYCRLLYSASPRSVTLEAIVPGAEAAPRLELLAGVVAGAGGQLQTQADLKSRSLQVALSLPIESDIESDIESAIESIPAGTALRITCRQSLVQLGLTQLAISAGFTVCSRRDPAIPLLTDDISQIASAHRVIWVQQEPQALPPGIQARLDLSSTVEQLQQAIEAVNRDQVWGWDQATEPPLSERELAILRLLTQGCRDREIAERLIISESTVKFHMNNVLAKLKARTRCQAISLATISGWM